jgi:hypothetical protein
MTIRIDRINIDRYLPRCEIWITEYDENDQLITQYSCKNRAVYDVYIYPDNPEIKRYFVMKSCEEHIDEAKKLKPKELGA